jgi:hypothetical protein
MNNMENVHSKPENKIVSFIEMDKRNCRQINGGAYNLWHLLGYVLGVNSAIHVEHAETAPWVGFGSK